MRQGLADPNATVGQANAIADGIGSRASLCLIPSCGHAPHREAPRGTLETMRQFIRRGQESIVAADNGCSC